MSEIMSEMKRCLTLSARIQNLRWTQLESALTIMTFDVDNSSFGDNLTIEALVKRGIYQRCVRTP